VCVVHPHDLSRILLRLALVAVLSCGSGGNDSNEVVVASVTRCTAARAPAVAGELPLEGRRKEFFSKYPLAQLQYGGGRVLSAPRIVGVFFGADLMQRATEALLASYGCTSYWRDAVNEYGVGDALYARTVSLSEFPALEDAGSPVQAFEAWIVDAIAANTFGQLNEEDVLLFFLPPSVRLLSDDCSLRPGAHSSVVTRDNRHIAYAYFDACSASPGPEDLIARSHAATHELIEMATDPDPLTAPAYRTLGAGVVAPTVRLPTSLADDESGDLCNDVIPQVPDYPFAVALGYSNRLARAGLDPCHSSSQLSALAVVGTPGPQPAGIDLSSGRTHVVVDVFSADPSALHTLTAVASLWGDNGGESFRLLDPSATFLLVRDGDAIPLDLHLSLPAFLPRAITQAPSREVIVELCDVDDAGFASPCIDSRNPITALPPLDDRDAGAQDGASDGDTDGAGSDSD
jgi:hypothetical protein